MGMKNLRLILLAPRLLVCLQKNTVSHLASNALRMQKFHQTVKQFWPFNMRPNLPTNFSNEALSSTKTIDLKDLSEVYNGGETVIFVFTNLELDELPQCKLAVKVFRSIENNRAQTVERCRPILNSLRYLQTFQHPNLSPIWFNDIVLKGQPVSGLTTPFYENGDIYSFCRRNPNIDRMNLTRGIARGLAYLHRRGVSHGNLCPNNILVTDEHEARITDVGLNALSVLHFQNRCAVPPSQWLWKSPEELKRGMRGIPQDVYAFASTAYIVLNDKRPVNIDPTAYMQGFRYLIETNVEVPWQGAIDVDVWALLQKCWEYSPAERPKMQQVNAEISGMSGSE